MTKDELKKYRAIQRRIEAKEEEAERLRAKIEAAPSQTVSGIPRGTAINDRMADMVAKLVDLREKINAEYDDLVRQRDKILKAINSLEPRYALILEKRYIQDLRWEQIAVDLNYSWRQLHNIHSEALKKIAHYCT